MSVNPTQYLFSSALEPRSFTVAEYEVMLEAGVVPPDSKTELLAGIITEKMGTGSVHDYIVGKLMELFVVRLAALHVVRVQSPIELRPHSRPEPDLWISKPGTGPHRDATITAADLALVVEVADSSLQRDRDAKLPIYAAAGIPEYWLVDVKAEQLEIYTSPTLRDEANVYLGVATYGSNDTFRHALLGEVVLRELLR